MIKRYWNRIPNFFKSFYFLATSFFLFWMAFVDSNDVFLQMNLSKKEKDFRTAKAYYEDKILEIKNQHEALTNDPYLLEKIAREKYHLKKANEDVYIVVKKD